MNLISFKSWSNTYLLKFHECLVCFQHKSQIIFYPFLDLLQIVYFLLTTPITLRDRTKLRDPFLRADESVVGGRWKDIMDSERWKK